MPSNDTILLRTTDGDGKEVEVPIYLLKAHSSFFCDMLSLPGIRGDVNESNQIDFPASYSDTVLLVEAMRELSTIKVNDWATAQRLLKICRQFDFALVGTSIASQLGGFVKQAPMRIFAIASQYDNVP